MEFLLVVSLLSVVESVSYKLLFYLPHDGRGDSGWTSSDSPFYMTVYGSSGHCTEHLNKDEAFFNHSLWHELALPSCTQDLGVIRTVNVNQGGHDGYRFESLKIVKNDIDACTAQFQCPEADPIVEPICWIDVSEEYPPDGYNFTLKIPYDSAGDSIPYDSAGDSIPYDSAGDTKVFGYRSSGALRKWYLVRKGSSDDVLWCARECMSMAGCDGVRLVRGGGGGMNECYLSSETCDGVGTEGGAYYQRLP